MSDGGDDQGAGEVTVAWGRRRMNHHVSLEKSLVSSRLARKSGSSSTIDKQTTVAVHECVIGAENTPLRRPMFLKALINADLC